MKMMLRKHVLIASLTLVLLLSLALNLFLFTRAWGYYLAVNMARLDPLNLRAYPSTPDQAQPEAPGVQRVVFFGDSRADQWQHPADQAGFRFINRGIGAQTSAQVWQRYQQHVQPLRPAVLVLQVGINDLKTIPLFPEHRDAIVADCIANIQQIVASAQSDGAVVVLTTIFPRSTVPIDRWIVWSPEVDRAVSEVNEAIRGMAAPNVLVFDTHAVLAEAGLVRAEYALDMLHLNAAGYAALNSRLVPLLANIRDQG